METLGPNTNAPGEMLHPTCVICAGEERRELVAALRGAKLGKVVRRWRYRCYEFWRRERATVVWTGIGTGAIEPLLWEVLGAGVVKRAILVGTAGRAPPPGRRLPLGAAYAVTEAYLAGTGLDQEGLEQPLRPRWELSAGVATARAVSTDLYYGFAPQVLRAGHPLRGGHVARRYRELKGRYDLVDMEVGPFYALCGMLGGKGLQYLAIKGPANPLGEGEEQVERSGEVLRECVRVAGEVIWGMQTTTRGSQRPRSLPY